VHALLGVVRAGVFTTGLQVASRVTLIWWIVEFYDVKSEPAYVSMLGAWSVTEVVRYCYFVVSLTGQVPGFLIWLRYVLPFVFIYTFESFMSSLSRAFYSSRCVMWLHFACFIRFLAD
jgi:Protein tyrosine phosphatase-like protein, PTPLA